MAVLTMAARKKIPSSKFALPGKGKGPHGKGAGSYPIPDKAHARNALARVSQHGTSAEKATVRAKVKRAFPDIGKKQLGGVVGVGRGPGWITQGGPYPIGGGRGVAPTQRIPGRQFASAVKRGGVISKKQLGGVAPLARPPRAPRMPRAGGLVGGPPKFRAAPITPRIPGRLSSSAGMKGGGVSGVSYGKKPHTYASGGVVAGRSGDRSPATIGKMSGHGGFAQIWKGQ
jgi:hypothetical protein